MGGIATTVARLEAILTAHTHGFTKAMDKAETKMQKTSRAAAYAGAAIAGGLAVGMQHAISDASDLHEQINKVDVVFGKSGPRVVAWSKTLTHSFGLSSTAALEAAGTYGNMLKPMGIAPRLVAKMSTGMTALAGDMASFNNASPADTLDAIRSGLAGQVRPLRVYGVFLDQERIKLEAVSKGLVKTQIDSASVTKAKVDMRDAIGKATTALHEHGKGSIEYAKAAAQVGYVEAKVSRLLEGKVPKLTAAQKAQATYGLIMQDTSDAQGDFARTAGGVANQQRILHAQLTTVSAQLGMALLPAMTKVLGVSITMIGFFEKHKVVTKALAVGLGVLAAALLSVKIRQIALNLAVLANPYVAATVAILAMGAALVILWQHSKTARKIIEIVTGVITMGLAPAIIETTRHWGGLTGAMGSAADKAEGVTGRILRALQGILKPFGKAISTLIVGVSGLKDAFGAMWYVFGKIISGFRWLVDNVKKIGGVFGAITGAVGSATSHLPHGDVTGGLQGGSGVFSARAAAEGKAFGVGKQLWDEIGMGEMVGLSVTSGYRPGAITKHGTPSDHGVFPSHAVDMAGSAGGMASLFKALIGRREVKQAFYDPLGSIFGGVRSSYREGGHSDHIHVAEYDKGGYLRPGWNLAYNGLGRPEQVGGGDIIIPVSVGGEHIATVIFDQLRRKAKVFENRNGRPAFGGA